MRRLMSPASPARREQTQETSKAALQMPAPKAPIVMATAAAVVAGNAAVAMNSPRRGRKG
jgi:hypothetical protein